MGTPFFMQTVLALFLISIATWRVSYMLVDEDGPFQIFIRFRIWTGITEWDDGRVTVADSLPWWKAFLAGVFSCIYCMSIWVGFFFGLFYAPNVQAWLLYSLFCSTVAIFLDQYHEKLRNG